MKVNDRPNMLLGQLRISQDFFFQTFVCKIIIYTVITALNCLTISKKVLIFIESFLSFVTYSQFFFFYVNFGSKVYRYQDRIIYSVTKYYLLETISQPILNMSAFNSYSITIDQLNLMINKIQQIISALSQDDFFKNMFGNLRRDPNNQNIIWLEVFLFNYQKEILVISIQKQEHCENPLILLSISLLDKKQPSIQIKMIDFDEDAIKNAIYIYLEKSDLITQQETNKQELKTLENQNCSSPVQSFKLIIFQQKLSELEDINPNVRKIFRQELKRIVEREGNKMMKFQAAKQLVYSKRSDSEVILNMLAIQEYQAHISHYLAGSLQYDISVYKVSPLQKLRMMFSMKRMDQFCKSIFNQGKQQQ